jgi:PEP-CTERM motif
MNFKSIIGAAVLAIATASSAQAANLVVNGGFETWGLGANSDEFSTQYGPGNGQLQGWTTTGLAFVFVPGDPDAVGRYNGFSFWGPSNGTNNGLTTSSQGGNYIGSDADRGFGAPISQTLTGLTIGTSYNVSFEWAAAQQFNFFGDTTEAWEVFLTDSGNNQIANFQTAILNNPERGFQPWRGETFSFIATETSHALTFFANGGPGGLPPFALLDNVSVTDVPEPSSWVMLVAGFGLVGATARRRRLASVAA